MKVKAGEGELIAFRIHNKKKGENTKTWEQACRAWYIFLMNIYCRNNRTNKWQKRRYVGQTL